MGVANEPPGKHEVARKLLLKGTVFVHLDPRKDGVVVPAWLKRQPQLVLQVGLDMPLPIPDLRVDDAGVYGTLSFSRTAFSCSVPWEAVFALAGDDGRGMVWPGSMPEEIAAEVARESGRGRVRSVAPDERSDQRIAESESAQGDRDDGPSGAFRPRTAAPAMADRPRALLSPRPSGLSPDRRAPTAASVDRATQTKRRVLPPYLRVVK